MDPRWAHQCRVDIDSDSMNIAVIHNRYREPGGEVRVFEMESELLEQLAHSVTR